MPTPAELVDGHCRPHLFLSIYHAAPSLAGKAQAINNTPNYRLKIWQARSFTFLLLREQQLFTHIEVQFLVSNFLSLALLLHTVFLCQTADKKGDGV